MFVLKAESIIPGVGIGPIRLGSNENSIPSLSEFSLESRIGCRTYIGENVMIWVDNKSNNIYQILVYGNFQGKLLNRFGIGTYLTEMEGILKEKVVCENESFGIYVFPSIPGVAFELQDLDIPDNLLEHAPYENFAPIESISVYESKGQFFCPDKQHA